MKESNEFQETPGHSVSCINYDDKLNASELDKIMDLAGKKSVIDQNEIRELTKIILKIDPVEVDEYLQAKFNQIMHKVRTQYA